MQPIPTFVGRVASPCVAGICIRLLANLAVNWLEATPSDFEARRRNDHNHNVRSHDATFALIAAGA